ncbi:hypothetical protein RHGRI_018050 [Rhododendron griersonianum]|uniref:Uncharacterized protein n=1 Tax=Rhododendron griersonianum TaxID=479676 RepID=A0AAV6K066_9ERIC|nr:hypothetical protein RHGRI_018050 [Rhododendron griersonianum]
MSCVPPHFRNSNPRTFHYSVPEFQNSLLSASSIKKAPLSSPPLTEVAEITTAITQLIPSSLNGSPPNAFSLSLLNRFDSLELIIGFGLRVLLSSLRLVPCLILFARVLPLAIRLGNYWTIAVSSYLLRQLLDYYCFVYLTTQEVRLRLNVEVAVPSESTPVPPPIESFTDMCLHSSIMKDMAVHKYSRPTSIQAQAMPVALSGRDLLGFAETDSGKIAAFTIPMIQHCLAQPLVRRGDGPLALVLAPTRTLAQRIEKEVKAFSRSLESFKTAIVVHGTNTAEQWSELRAGVNIVVATPRRFIEHLLGGNTSLSRISYVVLDEVDRMLDMGFQPLIEEVMRDLPVKHQTLLFSKTMRWDIESLAQEYLTDPVRVLVRKVSSSTAKEAQFFRVVHEDEKVCLGS